MDLFSRVTKFSYKRTQIQFILSPSLSPSQREEEEERDHLILTYSTEESCYRIVSGWTHWELVQREEREMVEAGFIQESEIGFLRVGRK